MFGAIAMLISSLPFKFAMAIAAMFELDRERGVFNARGQGIVDTSNALIEETTEEALRLIDAGEIDQLFTLLTEGGKLTKKIEALADSVTGGRELLRQSITDSIGAFGKDELARIAADQKAIMGIAEGNEEEVLQGFAALARDTGFEALAGDIGGQLGERRERILGDLEGLGEQERLDIETQFEGFASQTEQGLQSRGLAGTTILPTVLAGVQREETAAQGRLSERLRRERINLDTMLSGEQIAAEERLRSMGLATRNQAQFGGLAAAERFGTNETALATGFANLRAGTAQNVFGMGLQADVNLGNAALDSQQNLGLAEIDFNTALLRMRMGIASEADFARINAVLGRGQGLLGVQQSINLVPPDSSGFNNALNAFGQNAGFNPEQPGFFETVLPPFAGGVGAAGTSAALSSFGSVGLPLSFVSSVDAKEDITPIDESEVAAGIDKLNLYRWRYRVGPDRQEHIGPLAEEFNAAFTLAEGLDAKQIHIADAFGVAMAGVKALLAENRKLEARISRLETARSN